MNELYLLPAAHQFRAGKRDESEVGDRRSVGTKLFLGRAGFPTEDGGQEGRRRDDPGEQSVLYFRVPDIHAAYAGYQARGVDFIAAPHLIFRHPDGTEEWMAFFKDCDGQTLAFMAQVKPPEQARLE